MSLINQMLKDLEARQSGAVTADGGVIADLDPVLVRLPGDPVHRRWKLLHLSVGVVVIAATLVANLDTLVAPLAGAGIMVVTPLASVTPSEVAKQQLESTGPPAATLAEAPQDSFLNLRLSGLLGRPELPVGTQLALAPELAAEVEHLNAMLTLNPPAAGAPARPMVGQLSRSVNVERISLAATTGESLPVPQGTAAPVLKTQLPVSQEERAEASYRRGVKALRSGDGAIGDALLAQTLEIYPRHVKAREILAVRLLRSRRPNEAIALLVTGAEVLPGEAVFAELRAHILVEQGHIQAALEILQGAQPNVEQDPEYHAFRAALLQRAGLHERALAEYRGITLARPDQGVWWMGLGISLESVGDRAAALKAYRRPRPAVR